MQYTIRELADLAGVTTRTLRYYDQIGLLHPAGHSESGYRLYGASQVDRLQQILFYRELGVELDAIAAILDAPDFDEITALKAHRESLLTKKHQLEQLLLNVEQTLSVRERGTTMNDKEKFLGFKEQLIKENEEKYGKEIREKYGDETVDQSNARLMGLSQQDYDVMQALGDQVLATLDAAFATGDPAGELAQKAADLHRQWLAYSWKEYSAEAHRNLAEMYVADERFASYYDRGTPGKAQLLRDAIVLYTKV